MTFGYELILDAKNVEAKITEDFLKEFIYKLCEEIDMERYGECNVIYFGNGRFQGYSLFQFITTSSIVGHFTEDEAYLNVFSCKKYNKDFVKNLVSEWFKTNNVKATFLER